MKNIIIIMDWMIRPIRYQYTVVGRTLIAGLK